MLYHLPILLPEQEEALPARRQNIPLTGGQLGGLPAGYRDKIDGAVVFIRRSQGQGQPAAIQKLGEYLIAHGPEFVTCAEGIFQQAAHLPGGGIQQLQPLVITPEPKA